jgi:hypothetical protein
MSVPVPSESDVLSQPFINLLEAVRFHEPNFLKLKTHWQCLSSLFAIHDIYAQKRIDIGLTLIWEKLRNETNVYRWFEYNIKYMFRVAKRQQLVAAALSKTQANWKWARKWLDRNKTLPPLRANGQTVRPDEMLRCHDTVSSSRGGEVTLVPKLIAQAKNIAKGRVALGPRGWANAYDSEEDPNMIVGAWISVKWANGRFVCQVKEYDDVSEMHVCVYPSCNDEVKHHAIGGPKCDDWFVCPKPTGRRRERGFLSKITSMFS